MSLTQHLAARPLLAACFSVMLVLLSLYPTPHVCTTMVSRDRDSACLLPCIHHRTKSPQHIFDRGTDGKMDRRIDKQTTDPGEFIVKSKVGTENKPRTPSNSCVRPHLQLPSFSTRARNTKLLPHPQTCEVLLHFPCLYTQLSLSEVSQTRTLLSSVSRSPPRARHPHPPSTPPHFLVAYVSPQQNRTTGRQHSSSLRGFQNSCWRGGASSALRMSPQNVLTKGEIFFLIFIYEVLGTFISLKVLG